MAADTPEFYAKDRQAWRRWLQQNHDTLPSVWLVYDKGQNRALPWDAIVQEALCFGWVDSKAGRVSDKQSKIYVSRRKPQSAWSKINKGHVDYLLAHNLMTPAGQAAIDIAKQNGAWDKLTKVDNLEHPPELLEALAKNPKAEAFYNTLSPSSYKIILEWIYSAKREETKQSRIHETVKLAAEGIKAHHYRQ